MFNPRLRWLAATAALLVAGPLHDAAAQSRGGSGTTGSGLSSGLGAGVSSGGLGGGLSTSRGLSTTPSTGISPSPLAAPSAIGTPAPQVQPVAPLSPPPGSNFLSGGSANPPASDSGGGSAPSTSATSTPTVFGTTSPTTGGTVSTFPGGGGGPATSVSPSQSAPSAPGGGAPGVAACMGFWDAGTHMSKREWAAACQRIENRLQTLKSELNAAARKNPGPTTAPNPERRTRGARAGM